MPEESKLRMKMETVGAKEAARDVQEVAKAQEQVKSKVADTTAPVEKLTEAQGKLNASTEDYTSLLGRIHPVLGGLADGMVKGSRIAGDFATRQISVRDASRAMASALRASAGALKLLGAAGVAALGIGALVSVISRIRDEAKKAADEIKRQTDAISELDKKAQELAQNAAARASGAGRPLTGPQQIAIEESLRGIKEGTKWKEAAGDIMRATGGGAAGFGPAAGRSGLTMQEVEMAARTGFQIQEGAPADLQRRALQAHLKAKAEDIEITQEADAYTRQYRAKQAANAARSGAGGTADIESFISNLPGQGYEEADVKKLAAIVQALPGLAGKRSGAGDWVRSPWDKMWLEGVRTGARWGGGPGAMQMVGLDELALMLSDAGIEAKPGEIQAAQSILGNMGVAGPSMPTDWYLGKGGARSLVGRRDRGSFLGERDTGPMITYVGSRITYPDARSRDAAVVNGRTARDEVE